MASNTYNRFRGHGLNLDFLDRGGSVLNGRHYYGLGRKREKVSEKKTKI